MCADSVESNNLGDIEANLEHRVKAVLERVKVGPGRARDVVGVVDGGVLVDALLELRAEDLRVLFDNVGPCDLL